VTGSSAAEPATAPGQPRTSPLWLNSQRPSPNGAAAGAVTACPWWPNAPREHRGAGGDRASAANAVSAQIGRSLR
jgi:hypothetical protein